MTVEADVPAAAVPDQPLEPLYESDRTRVSRIHPVGASGSLIRKEMLGRRGVARARHELRIVHRLAGVPGVPQFAADRGADELLFRDASGVPLADAMQHHEPDPQAWVEFAAELAGIVGAVHLRGVVHKDINPSNVLVAGIAGRSTLGHPELIDFDLATTFGEERPRFTHHREIVGTLPYLAPEQTGRTGMPVDERADLYSLGATLYELVTGEPPFAVGDPLRMIHDILARAPVNPAARDPRVPAALSDILVRLLEKEPDRRYQSAEGLAHDLTRLRIDLAGGRHEPFALGERDFRLRLSAPSRLVGRSAEGAALRTVFNQALLGGCRGVLVAGAAGVGKSALVNGLRPVVTATNGWFVTGKFDQYRQDAEFDAVSAALGQLGRLLLAGTEAEVDAVRTRILGALGPNLAPIAAVPEFAALLGIETGQPTENGGSDANVAALRVRSAVLELLTAVASVQRPIVMVIDDLQWASPNAIGFMDAVLTDERLTGVLLVGAYRDREVDAAHPLTAALARWDRLGVVAGRIELANLPPADLGDMLGEMLRLPTREAMDLADAIGARSGGNPFDTVELVNALRRDGALVPGAASWSWEAATIRRFVGQGDIVDLLAARIYDLPRPSRELMEVMACLGGEMELEVLRIAAGLTAAEVDEYVIAPLEDGLLVLDNGVVPAVRFRHDRVQQAAYSRLSPAVRRVFHLTAARRLAAAHGLGSIAAEQYLQAVDALTDPTVADAGEGRAAAGLFVAAAATVRVLNPAAADRFLVAAVALLSGFGGPALESGADDPLLVAAERHQHAVLYSLGRLAETDAAYARIERRSVDPVDPVDLVEPACIQMASLTNRAQPRAAVDLGLALLQRLGIDVPLDFTAETVRRGSGLAEWAAGLVLADDLRRPEPDNQLVRMTARLISTLKAPSFFTDPAIAAWLIVVSQRLWVDNGPFAPLVANLSGAMTTTILLRQDYLTGYAISRHVIGIGEARGYEPETSQARYVSVMMVRHWFEPLEDSILQAQLAREGLIRGGDVQVACFTHYGSLAAQLDCASTLDSCAVEVESALAFAARTGNSHATGAFLVFRQLLRALRGETAEPGSFDDADFDEVEHLTGLGRSPIAAGYFHVYRALSAALFADSQSLIRHAAAAMLLLPAVVGGYQTALAHLLQGMALADRLRAANVAEQPALVAELDLCLDWLTTRAADAPGNFGHLATLLTAERAWAVGDLDRAGRAFDAARREVGIRNRPWHHALITERAAAFHHDSGLVQIGRDLFADAQRQYLAWCAAGKVRHLDEQYPYLRSSARRGSSSLGSTRPSSGMSADEIDMLAILRASQALSSETDPDGLRSRLGAILQSMTGADTVLIALREGESDDWLVWDTTGQTASAVPLVTGAGLFPLSAFRYALRTREPLLVEDAVRDERFTRDPYLSGLKRCSLLIVPILGRGAMRAVLVLENRRRRGAFAAGGLDAVMLVTGQLTVSLDNAQLYASLEGKVTERTTALAERTAALEEANLKLEAMSNTDALTGLPNRRRFDTTLDAEWRRAARQGTPLGLAMIDVDQFKRYNDHYGHPAGDDCLRIIAAALRTGMRGEPDIVCRYGGEEFAAILPGTDEFGAVLVAERMRAAVVGLRRPHGSSDLGAVSVSIGVAAHFSVGAGAVADLIVAADAALYEAKVNGRNRVYAEGSSVERGGLSA